MKTRSEFRLSDEQLQRLLAACQPVSYMVFGGIAPRSPQENANDAWDALGCEMGFVGRTAEGVPGKGACFFTAEPIENNQSKGDQ